MNSDPRQTEAIHWPDSVVCFGGEDWWYHNRAHCDIQLMRRLARHSPVLYVNSIVMRKLNIGEGAMFWRRLKRKLGSISRGLVKIDDRFWVYSPFTAPVHHIPGARNLNARLLKGQIRLTVRRLGVRNPLVWVNIPSACYTALALRRSGLVYQRTDRYEDYPGVDVQQVVHYDRTLKREADLTFFSNRFLYESEAGDCRQAIYVDHGVDFEAFAEAHRDAFVPPEMNELKRPIIGFFGGIDGHTFDMPLMADVVARMPDVTFVFVGKSSLDCEPLTRHDHVVRVEQRPAEMIPHYGKQFDVCIMPFNQNRWIEGCNPIKLKEYLALGKPVVSTPFGELAHYDGLVRVAKNAAEFEAALRDALGDLSDQTVAARRERVAGHSWHSKAEQIISALHATTERPAGDTTTAASVAPQPQEGTA